MANPQVCQTYFNQKFQVEALAGERGVRYDIQTVQTIAKRFQRSS